MHIELTERERLLAQQGQPVEVIDPATNAAYVLIARERFEQVLPLLLRQAAPAAPESRIPEGIRISQEAFRRDLPDLLKQKKLYRKWVAYNRNDRIAIGPSGNALTDACFKRGLSEDEFYVGWIHPCELVEEEELEVRPQHYEGYDDEDT